MSRNGDNTDPLEQELKSFIEKLNNENEALSKILSGVIQVRAPDSEKANINDESKNQKRQINKS